MRSTVSICLPDEIAKETGRPRSFHIQKALEAYIEDFADLRIAIDRLRNPKMKLFPEKS
jgi:RHH-type rel operon transcriptional repressor/antitoxin RelB